MPKNLVELVKEEDFDSFLQNNKLVLVKFSAGWCPPCQVLQRNIEELLKQPEEQQKDLMVLKVDVEKFPSLAQRPQFGVNSIPTFFLFHQGKMIKEGHGNRNVQQLKQFITV
jgi:thioredoxin 1